MLQKDIGKKEQVTMGEIKRIICPRDGPSSFTKIVKSKNLKG